MGLLDNKSDGNNKICPNKTAVIFLDHIGPLEKFFKMSLYCSRKIQCIVSEKKFNLLHNTHVLKNSCSPSLSIDSRKCFKIMFLDNTGVILFSSMAVLTPIRLARARKSSIIDLTAYSTQNTLACLRITNIPTTTAAYNSRKSQLSAILFLFLENSSNASRFENSFPGFLCDRRKRLSLVSARRRVQLKIDAYFLDPDMFSGHP